MALPVLGVFVARGFVQGLTWVAQVLAVTLTISLVYQNAINNPDLPAKIRQWISDHKAEFEGQLRRNEPREPTPVTHPVLFKARSINNSKVFAKANSDEIWQADYLHGTHFEVYANQREFGKGRRIRAVWLDGRHKPL